MKAITQKILFCVLGITIQTCTLQAAQELDWSQATTSQKITQLKKYLNITLQGLSLAVRANINDNKPLLASIKQSAIEQWKSLIEGKKPYHGKGIIPFIDQLFSKSPENDLLSRSLKGCHNTSQAIINFIVFYKNTYNAMAGNRALTMHEKYTYIQDLGKNDIDKLSAKLEALSNLHTQLTKTKFDANSNEKNARDFLLFFNHSLQKAVRNILTTLDYEFTRAKRFADLLAKNEDQEEKIEHSDLLLSLHQETQDFQQDMLTLEQLNKEIIDEKTRAAAQQLHKQLLRKWQPACVGLSDEKMQAPVDIEKIQRYELYISLLNQNNPLPK